MPSHRDVRDPIHGFIRVESREGDIVDTRLFQRLRRLRQLAMAYLVYPTATHSRFEHTLGVLHVAGRMCQRLEIDSHHTRLIRLAALLHDVGHGPFSHPSESVLAKLAPDDVRNQAGGTDKIHELITQQIILRDRELDRFLSDQDRQDIVQLLGEGLDQPLYRQVISGPLDADKQDYLLRDSYFSGVRYGVFDMERLHGVLNRSQDANGDVIIVDADGVHTLEQFVLARYFLTTQVIRHKGRLITDAMLVRGLVLGVQRDRIDFLRTLYTFEDSDAFRAEYLSWNDERLMTRLLEPEWDGTFAGRMFRRLADRRLFKRVFSRSLADLSAGVGLSSGQLEPVLSQVEAEVAALLSELGSEPVAAEDVILEVVKAPAPRKSEGSVLLKGVVSDLPQTFEQQSLLFRSIDESLRVESLECYAPVTLRDESKRQHLEGRVSELIIQRVEELLSSASESLAGQSGEARHAD